MAVNFYSQVHFADNVGIGTTSPAVKLDVVGDAQLQGTAPRFVMKETGGNDDFSLKVQTDGRFSVFNNNLASEVLTIEQSGNVGIGTTSPDTLLEVSKSTGAAVRITSTATGNGADVTLGSLEYYGNDASVPGAGIKSSIVAKTEASLGDDSNLIFSTSDGTTNNIERLRINSSGDVGIGTTAPDHKFHVEFTNGDTSFSGGSLGNWGSDGIRIENTHGTVNTMAMLQFRNSDADIHIAGIRQGANDSDLGFFFEGSEKMRITSSGNVGIGTTSPDAKLHVNGTLIVAEDSEKGLDINTQTYNYKIGDIDAGESQTYIEVDSVNAKTTLHNSTLELGHASDTTIARASAGKVTIEGNEIQTTNVHHHFLNSGFYLSYPYSRYIPLNGSISEQNVPGSTPEYTGFIWPYDGYVKTIWVRSEANSGNTLMQLYKGTNGSTNGGTAMGSVTEACGAHTSVEFDFTGVTNSFNQGEGMAIKIDPTNTSQGVIVTIECVFNLTT